MDFTVGNYIQKISKEEGTDIDIVKFVRFETGEGIEKKQEDFQGRSCCTNGKLI